MNKNEEEEQKPSDVKKTPSSVDKVSILSTIRRRNILTPEGIPSKPLTPTSNISVINVRPVVEIDNTSEMGLITHQKIDEIDNTSENTHDETDDELTQINPEYYMSMMRVYIVPGVFFIIDTAIYVYYFAV